MSPHSALSAPWPAQTPLPTASSSSSLYKKRSFVEGRSVFDNVARAIVNQSEIDAAKTQCFVQSSNAVWSCWPTEATTLDQGDSTQFVWNSNQPSLLQFDLVDIALIRADSGATVSTFLKLPNPTNRAGSQPVTVDDPWWGANGASWPGSPVPFPFYFVIVPSGQDLIGGVPQATFTATQTTFASSVLASMSSASVASSSSAAAASSSAAASRSSQGLTNSPSASGTSSLQNGSQNSSPFPHWAIAVISILGFFALLAFVMLVFLVVHRVRRDKDQPSRRGSMGSQSPMIANVQSGASAYPSSPPVPSASLAPALIAPAAVAGSADGASLSSDTPFSGADAAVMAEAFRKALRKPDFAGRPVEEGESPEQPTEGEPPELMNRELAEEGRDIRSVGSSRGVRVEGLSDDGDATTVHDSTI